MAIPSSANTWLPPPGRTPTRSDERSLQGCECCHGKVDCSRTLAQGRGIMPLGQHEPQVTHALFGRDVTWPIRLDSGKIHAAAGMRK